ncbi:MAG: hypothetical protein IAE82_05555 [Opitutaceae bacterium]|nr:hypothetical protein [Opitutaceae bacterium]
MRALLSPLAVMLVFVGLLPASSAAPINRHELVKRHNPIVRTVDPDAPLIVGNGNFAFGCDITGLQTFSEHYQRWGVPVEILSRWAWISDENPHKHTLADASKDFTLADGRVLPFPTRSSTPAGDWLRKNPRDLPLGQLALHCTKADGSALAPADIQEPEQSLDLWTGIVTSRFKIEGIPVVVTTACHPQQDTVAVRIESPLVAAGKLSVRLAFPRGHDVNVKNTPGLDWSQPETHRSELELPNLIVRRVGSTRYFVPIRASGSSPFAVAGQPHTFELCAQGGASRLDVAIGFQPVAKFSGVEPTAEEVLSASAYKWMHFWLSSAAVDFSGSTNPLAAKIENRIILSRYLMAAQMAGDVPPQESGLTCSTWYGKHHTEMIWWHAAHFPIWGNDELLARNLAWYQSQLPAARELAKSRGLKGARWAKMTGPEMRESPGGNPLIVWNQPHMVYLCELLYRNKPTAETLARYRDLVLETADCLATMVWLDPKRDQYVLGPPLWIAQEIYDQATSQNPSFELAYWRWALLTAQQWRERLGLPREAQWDDVIARLAPIPQKDGKYVALESYPDTWDNIESRHDHPTMLGPLGVLPGGPDVDRATMERTLDAVLAHWDWETKIWGWDYPMIAMTAARLGRPETAVEILMRDGPNNRYLPTGHVPQRSDEKMPKDPPPGARKREIATYFPGNGAFLAAVGLMVAGWDGCTTEFPGFPKDGTWTIRAEGLSRFP